MRKICRQMLALASLACCLAAAPMTGVAQDYPIRAVKIVVPYPAGGSNDIVARLLAQRLTEKLGQPFVVDNKAGASGNIGAEFVARSAPDGYTLLVVTTGHAIHPAIYQDLRYDIRKDLAPVAELTAGPLLVMVNPASGIQSLQDLVRKAKSDPNALNYASGGNGASTHLAVELLKTQAGIRMTHIPFGGSTPSLLDVMAGNTQLVTDLMLAAAPQVRAGKLKAIAITGAKRSPAMPDVPTVAESGLPGYEVVAWNGLMAPAGTPPKVIARLSEQLRTELASPELAKRLSEQGFDPAWAPPERFGELIRSEIDRWGKVVRDAGIKPN